MFILSACDSTNELFGINAVRSSTRGFLVVNICLSCTVSDIGRESQTVRNPHVFNSAVDGLSIGIL